VSLLSLVGRILPLTKENAARQALFKLQCRHRPLFVTLRNLLNLNYLLTIFLLDMSEAVVTLY